MIVFSLCVTRLERRFLQEARDKRILFLSVLSVCIRGYFPAYSSHLRRLRR
jgi:uncharacterized membrane protein